jgi:probable O-glycosylation ligase (exosortase A-associated)
MPLRDLLVTVIVLGSLPVCFARPWIGIVMWYWIAYMNPHRLAWGFAYDFPFAQLIAVATLAGLLFTRDRRPLPMARETWLLLALWALFTLSTIFALYPAEAWDMWQKVSKIFLFTLLTMVLCQERERLRILMLTIALSLGFYAVKGGVFTLTTGGVHRVQYPSATSMGGNTGLGLALDMALAMFFFLAREETNRWLRRLLQVMGVFAVPSILFSYSRGAVLGFGAVLFALGLRSRRKALVVLGALATVAFVWYFAPQQWFERMETIERYEEDRSARMRLESWYVFYRVGLDRPLLGAGFWGPAADEVFYSYLPDAIRAQNAHNSFLNVMGEHGLIALGVYVALILSCLLTLQQLQRRRRGVTPPGWVVSYAAAIQVAIVGYVAAGVFLSAAYLEFFYNLVGLTVVLKTVARREMEQAPAPAPPLPAAERRSARVRAGWNR